MRDRPTFWEYLFMDHKDVVKRNDGSYFAATNLKKALFLSYGIFGCLMIAFFALYYTIAGNQIWRGYLSGDFATVFIITSVLCKYLSYRFTRYKRIAEDSDDYTYASGLEFGCNTKISASIMMCVVLIFFALQSTGAAYVRYWLGSGARVVQGSIAFHGSDDSLLYAVDNIEDSDSVIRIPALPGDASGRIIIETSGSPEPMQLSLGSNTGFVHPGYKCRWVWDADYFVQSGCISDVHIRDGSVLTLTCGDLVREWVFDVADEEAS